MLQKADVVRKARKALEALYEGTCTVIEHRKIKNANMSTGFKDVEVIKNKPCRLSFKTITNTNQLENGATAVVQVVTLFISPDVLIKAGSKIVVTQNGITTEYQQSGMSAVYDTHQEIVLELFREWA